MISDIINNSDLIISYKVYVCQSGKFVQRTRCYL